MINQDMSSDGASHRRRFTGKQVFAIAAASVLVTAVIAAVVVRIWVFPSEFRPVKLNDREAQVLAEKIDRLEAISGLDLPVDEFDETGALKPEAYSEDDAAREIHFTEKELNALIARNTDLASRFAIDLSSNLASAKLLVPTSPDFPVIGGRIIRVRAGLELAYEAGRPVVVLRGISVMGVPLPNAWLGNLKNVDLVKQFGGNRGFWRAFSEGVEFIRVEDGELHIKLKA